MSRFSAKLLFQYRSGAPEDSIFRICEERIVTFNGNSPSAAYRTALTLGKKGQSSHINNEGIRVYIEFIGLIDMMELGMECEDYDVWYEIKTMRCPMERKSNIIPRREDLSIFGGKGTRTKRNY